jgi:hypothetical protein
MGYSQFKTLNSVKQTFGISIQEGDRFLPNFSPLEPSEFLSAYLHESLPIVASSGSEKARSEGIIYPILFEVRRILARQISLFSGEEFTVDEDLGLTGICDFILTRSPEVLEIESPVVVIVEAKRTDLKSGLGQCIAEMIAAQRFNQNHHTHPNPNPQISAIYGSVTNGIQWQWMRLMETTVDIDLNIYPLPPIDRILGDLVGMVRDTD